MLRVVKEFTKVGGFPIESLSLLVVVVVVGVVAVVGGVGVLLLVLHSYSFSYICGCTHYFYIVFFLIGTGVGSAFLLSWVSLIYVIFLACFV